eukprot:6473810-Amphidinium_carterae.1
MRQPTRSISKLGGAHRRVGARILAEFSRHLVKHPRLRHACLARLGHEGASGPDTTMLTPVRDILADIVGPITHLPRAEGIDSALDLDLLAAWAKACDDPDTAVLKWFQEGAPLGMARPLDSCGIFPAVQQDEPAHSSDLFFDSDSGWLNYKGVDYNSVVEKQLRDMVNAGYLKRFDAFEEMRTYVGNDPIVSKFALMEKAIRLPSGELSIKHRMILDMRRSGANALAAQNQRILLPFPRDVVLDAISIHAAATRDGEAGGIEALILDIKDAFYQIPIHPSERRYTTAAHIDSNGKQHFYVFVRLPMGGKNPPQCWGRVAALLARLLQGVLPPLRCRLQLFVDDPILVAYGTKATRALYFCCFCLALSALNLRLAWHKGA